MENQKPIRKKRLNWYWYLIGAILLLIAVSPFFNKNVDITSDPSSEEYAQTIRWDEWRSEDPEDNQLELTDELIAEMLSVEYGRVAFLHYQLDEEFEMEEVAPLGIALASIEENRTLAQITVDGLPYIPQEHRYAVWMLSPDDENYRLLGPLIPLADQMGESPAWELLYAAEEAWPQNAILVVTQEESGDPPAEPSMEPLLAGQLDAL